MSAWENYAEIYLPRGKDIPETPGVYLLCSGGEVVYVGQSKNIKRRMARHAAQGTKAFSAVGVIMLPAAMLDDAEALLIACYQPKYNKNSGNGNPTKARDGLPDIYAEWAAGYATSPDALTPQIYQPALFAWARSF